MHCMGVKIFRAADYSEAAPPALSKKRTRRSTEGMQDEKDIPRQFKPSIFYSYYFAHPTGDVLPFHIQFQKHSF